MTRPTGFRADEMPTGAAGWRAAGQPRIYEGTGLYDYIDGAAEPYLHYGFRCVVAQRYTHPERHDIVADVFEMADPAAAYGIFSFEREGPDVGLGQDSELEGGLLRFWKGRYFVSILAEGGPEQAREAALELGREIAAGVQETGSRPDLLRALPREGLIPERVRYLRHHALLNYHYYVADEDLLGLGADTEAALASYAHPGGNVRLLVVRYPDARQAEEGMERFAGGYAPDARGDVVRTEDGRWTAIARRGALGAVVFGAPSRHRALELLDAVGTEER